MNIPEIDLPRVVVIGGGFAGLKLLKKIDSRHYQVVLIDRNNYHTFQPLMYQVATAGLEPGSIAYPLRKIFKHKKNFYFRMADVNAVDTENKQVHTSIGDLHYDHLVIATGAQTNYFGMKDVEKYSLPMKDLVESLNLRSLILQNLEKALNTEDLKERERLMNFVIVGAGPTGVELSGALAELKSHVLPRDYPDLDLRRMQIHLVEADERVLSAMSTNASDKAFRFLRKLGVNVWLDTMVKGYDGSTVQTNKKNFPTNTMIWAAGVMGQPVAGIDAELVAGQRLQVDEFFQVAGKEDVYALGDVAAMISEQLPKGHPMLASVASQQGASLAKMFNNKVKGKSSKGFKYNDKGTMATVGRNLAVVDLPRFKFSGFFAWVTWMFVHLMLLVDFRSRVVVFINWAWSYINYDKGLRLIVRKVQRDDLQQSAKQEEEELALDK